MIEVEINIVLKGIERFLECADFVGERVIKDVYYDTKNYTLTLKDIWLRKRDNRFELKLPLNKELNIRERITDEYRELETEEEIREALHISMQNIFEKDLERYGYTPFASIVTTRKKYKKDGFTVDIDSADFGYEKGEIELLVENESEIHNARARILQFIREYHLTSDNGMQGKVAVYLKKFCPKHYKALVGAGVINE